MLFSCMMEISKSVIWSYLKFTIAIPTENSNRKKNYKSKLCVLKTQIKFLIKLKQILCNLEETTKRFSLR